MPNLLKRVLVGAIGIPILLWGAIHGGWPLWVIIVLLQAGSMWEWARLSRAQGVHPNGIGMSVATVGVDALIFTDGRAEAVAAALIGLAAMLLCDVRRRDRHPLRDLSAAMLFVAYVALPFALWSSLGVQAGPMRWAPLGPLAALFIATWICDTAAYVFGRSFGRRKLDVAASPNKTVEGFVAGLVFAGATLPAMAAFDAAKPSVLDYVVLPLIVGLAGQVGDLLESLIKRDSQVKDTSTILPGHGGILDRFDSLFLSTPLLFAYLLLSPP